MKHLLLAFLLILLVGCTATKHTIIQKWSSQGRISNSLPPDSVKAELTIEVSSPDGNESFDASLYAIPSQRYRMELKGPLGIRIGSFLWQNKEWTLILPRDEDVYMGKGAIVTLGPLQTIDVHTLFAPVWGELLPKGWESAKQELIDERLYLSWQSVKDTLSSFTAIIDTSNGEILSLSQTGNSYSKKIGFEKYNDFGHDILPQKITYAPDSKTKVILYIKDIYPNKSMSKRVWKLNIPESYNKYYAN